MKKRIVVLASGGGTNFQSIIDGVERGEINAQIVALVSSNHTAYAIERAKKHNIPTHTFALKDYFGSSEKRNDALYDFLIQLNPDLIVLAGYLGVIDKKTVCAFRRKIINIHPALLPKFGGAGYYGLNVHKAVINAGEKISGATVHYVDEGTDTGEIIAQQSLEVYDTDTPESLQQRILTEIEHKLFCTVIAKLCAE